jgi:cytoskeletal protein CcmA (bactofilin family)
MWDKKDQPAPRIPQPSATGSPAGEVQSGAAPPSGAAPGRGRANIGGSLFIKGEVSGSEDLIVEGRVEGKIDLKDHNLAIAKGGRVSADVHARSVTISGEVSGNIHADEKVEIAESGRVTGDLYAPRVAISDGAQFQGSVDMSPSEARKAAAATKEAVRVQVAARDSQPRVGTARPDEMRVAAQGKAAVQG